jgi:hypothetical protein
MPNSTTLLIAEFSGQGAYDGLAEWAQTAAARLASNGAIDRVGRYRKLNDTRLLLVAETGDAGLLERLKAVAAEAPAPFKAEFLVATQTGQRQRPDATGDMRDLPLLYTVTFPVPPEREAALGEWYDVEHVPMLQGCPYWPMTRRFRVEQPAPARWGGHLALHYLTDIQALRSPERDAARRTPWRDRISAEPWFRGTYNVYLQER